MWWLLIIVGSITFIYFKLVNSYKYWKRKNVPHKKPTLILGNMGRITFGKTSMAEGVQEMCNQFETRYFGVYQFFKPVLIVTDPDLLKQIGIKDFDYFQDHNAFIDEELDPLFGKNLVQLKGQKWRHMRATISPAFTSSKMKSMFVLMSDCAAQFADHFSKTAKSDQHITVDMKDVFTRFANDVIATCAFGIKCDSLAERDNEFYAMGKRATNFSGFNGFKFLIYGFSPLIIKLFKLKVIAADIEHFFRDMIQSTLKQREEKGIFRPDLINILMEAKKGKLRYEETVKGKDEDTGFATVEESHVGKETPHKAAEMTADEMTAQAMVFFLAGFDTVSTLMCHMAHELAVNPLIQERLQAEIDETLKNCKNGKITYDAITRMKYLDMVVCESLRKWPSAAITDRICNKTYTIEPVNTNEERVILHKDDAIWIPIFTIHRNPKNYSDPEKFDPERFSDENKGNINPLVFIPFGVGPRNCIGSRFALLEAKVIFFNLLSKMDLIVSEKTQVPLKISRNNINLSAEKGFWLGMRPRNMLNVGKNL